MSKKRTRRKPAAASKKAAPPSAKRTSSPKKRPTSPTFRQRLGSLTYAQACQLLGAAGPGWLREGRDFEIRADRDVVLRANLYEVTLDDAEVAERVTVSLWRATARAKELSLECSECEVPCQHQGAALAFLLESKTLLGLAQPPDESVPLEHLTSTELRERALAHRRKRAKEERMRVTSMKPKRLWTDYLVESRVSGRSYRVALRGWELGESYCTCPDFARSRLGTCKHILKVQTKARKNASKGQLRRPYRRRNLSLRVHYGDEQGGNFGLLFNLPHGADSRLRRLIGSADEDSITDGARAAVLLERLSKAGHETHVYPDAERLIQRALLMARLRVASADIRRRPTRHPLRKKLLRADLLPYQLDGIAFAAGAGRAILADDMGLGKTVQGIGTAELLAREVGISRVLVICPASVKAQWRSEIQRFCGRGVQLVQGPAKGRAEQYRAGEFFTLCNYEQVLRDVTEIEAVDWDLIVLDEGQRIKNWESKTSRAVRSLPSMFRLVLTGTPLENRLGELYTVVRFVDENLLGPADQFFHRHRKVDEKGKVTGYSGLKELREQLSPVLLRRTRSEVARQLPKRTDEVVLVEPTAEQKAVHDGQMSLVAQIASKPYLTHMDLLRLRAALTTARMACNSTWIVDQQEPEYSSKLERLGELLEDLLADPTRKIIIFSEWRRMLGRVEGRLDSLDARYVRLDGQVPQSKRHSLVAEFQGDPRCRAILMTNAGSTGLNLQSATTVINLDLPWNPAVLEQRIGRAHRMGQKNPVHVYKLVTQDTVEERLLDVLASKQDLADAVLDASSDVMSVSMGTGLGDLRQKLERIIDPAPSAHEDRSQRAETESALQRASDRRAEVAAASGQLVTAALGLAGQLLARPGDTPPEEALVERLTERLEACTERDASGRAQLVLTLPDQDSLRGLATTLARLLGES